MAEAGSQNCGMPSEDETDSSSQFDLDWVVFSHYEAKKRTVLPWAKILFNTSCVSIENWSSGMGMPKLCQNIAKRFLAPNEVFFFSRCINNSRLVPQVSSSFSKDKSAAGNETEQKLPKSPRARADDSPGLEAFCRSE